MCLCAVCFSAHGAAGWLKPGVPRALSSEREEECGIARGQTPREIANGCLQPHCLKFEAPIPERSPPRRRGPSNPRRVRLSREGAAYWMPACAGMTALETRFQFQTANIILARRLPPRYGAFLFPLRGEGARNAGLQPARGPVCVCETKHTSNSPTDRQKIPAFRARCLRLAPYDPRWSDLSGAVPSLSGSAPTHRCGV